PPDRGWPDLKGLVDDWNVVVQDADLDPALWRSRLALGETLSFYHNDWGDFLDYKATLHRGLGWVSYKHGAWAVTGWAAAAWIGENSVDVVNPWTSAVTPVFGYGGGALFWPGHQIEGDPSNNVDGPLPSVRLKLAREAVEDHDYLTLLAAQSNPDYARALVRGLIPRDYWDWDPAPEAIYALRDRIGRLLDSGAPIAMATVRGQVIDVASGGPISGVFVTDGASGALTDAAGHYTLIVRLPASGRATLIFSAPRYHAATRTVAVPAGGQATQDVALTHVAEESLILYSFETAGEVGEWEFANTRSMGRVAAHATEGSYALQVVFDDDIASAQADEWPAASVGTFPTRDWSSYTALELDVYNESDYYTSLDVSVVDAVGGEYPQTGGTITLLPNQSRHVIISMAALAASGVDLANIAWFEIAPETITDQEDYQGQANLWPLGPRTLYFDNLRLVQIGPD
ncbi:MAG: carboxypeptidase-like regulatory domain-containing protein, partial [Anaerolineae bacterium]